MINKIDKPRVFLSHSKLDIKFIKKLEDVLRKSQIDPWLDEAEIRAGRPWLKVLFEEGIPTCDCIIAYFTENSLKSEVFSKEVDAALIENLQNKNIVFLPYVDSKNTRDKLRLDIKALQCPEWNSKNFTKMLPKVISEIWVSYLESKTKHAVLEEENKRLKLELKLNEIEKKQKEIDVFSDAEKKEFEYIFNKLNEKHTVQINKTEKKDNKDDVIEELLYEYELIQLIFYYSKYGHTNISEDKVSVYFVNILKYLIKENKLDDSNRDIKYNSPYNNDVYKMINNLRMYNLISTEVTEKSFQTDLASLIPSSYEVYTHSFTERFYRFIFWIEYHKKLKSKFQFKKIDKKQKNS